MEREREREYEREREIERETERETEREREDQETLIKLIQYEEQEIFPGEAARWEKERG